jgi:hypothetical protein
MLVVQSTEEGARQMQTETWKSLTVEFNLTDLAPSTFCLADRWAMEVSPMVGLATLDGNERCIVASPLFLGWASPAEAVFTLGHECGHMVHGHESSRTGRLTQNEIEADRWGVLALVAHGFDPRVGPAFLGRLILDWTRPEDSTKPAVCELYERILAMEQFIADNLDPVSLPVAS